MKNLILVILLLIAAACTSKQQPHAEADTVTKKTSGIQYTCPMHPAVLSSKPGTCPKCGMELVEKDDSK